MQGGLKGSCTELVLRVLPVPGRRAKLLPQESTGEFCCSLVLHQSRWYHISWADKGSYQSGLVGGIPAHGKGGWG